MPGGGRIVSAHVDGPVLVGIDGSPDALRAMRLAGEIAKGLRTNLIVLHAVGLTAIVDGEHVVAEDHHTAIADQFSGWCESLQPAGNLNWEPQLRHGAPVDTILRLAGEVKAALVVIGRQGAGKRPELLLGSTAHQVAENCPCPVLVVPPVATSNRP